MLRIVLGVIAGFIAWLIVWVGVEKILSATLPEWYDVLYKGIGSASANAIRLGLSL